MQLLKQIPKNIKVLNGFVSSIHNHNSNDYDSCGCGHNTQYHKQETVKEYGKFEVIAEEAIKGNANFQKKYQEYDGSNNPLDYSNVPIVIECFTKADAIRSAHASMIQRIWDLDEENNWNLENPVWSQIEPSGMIILKHDGKSFNIHSVREETHETKFGKVRQQLYTQIMKDMEDAHEMQCITPSLLINTRPEHPDRRDWYKHLGCGQFNCPHCALQNTLDLIEKGTHTIEILQKMGYNFLFLTFSANQEIDAKRFFSLMFKNAPYRPKYFLVPEDPYHFHVIIERIGTWENMKTIIQDAVNKAKHSLYKRGITSSSGVLKIQTDLRAYVPYHWIYITKTFVDEMKMAEFLTWNKKGDAHFTHSNNFFIPMPKEIRKNTMKLNGRIKTLEDKRRNKSTSAEIKLLKIKSKKGRNLLNKIHRLESMISKTMRYQDTYYTVDIRQFIQTNNEVKEFNKNPDYVIQTFWQQRDFFRQHGIAIC